MADVDELRLLSGLLDQALDLAEPQREAWLATLDGDATALVPTLRALLGRAASRETAEWLDRGPSFTLAAEAGATPAFHAGDTVGPYRLLREIGQGGMGEVWLAERSDGQLKRAVALKLPMLGLRRSVLVQRFARERDILGGLAHPHIARLYDAGLAEDGQPYLALEHVDGTPITAFCSEHRLDLHRRVQLLLQVMEAVQHAHGHLVIHRDLKPSNVLVTAQGQAMLLDFGIAKLLQGEETQAAETELTQLGGRALTLDYAAPEQISGAPVGIAADVWALGVLLYELLAGQRPFKGARREVEQAILSQEPARLQGVPADLATIALKALKKAPAERYATVNAFAEDLGRWLGGRAVLAQPDSAWYRTRKFVGRNKAAVATAAGVLATVLVASAVALWQAQVALEQTRVAQTEARTAAAVQDFLENIFRANSGDQTDPVKARQRTAEQLLDEGAARIETALDDAPVAKLRVLKTLSQMFVDMGLLDRAAGLLELRTNLAERVFGPAALDTAQALAEWVDVLPRLNRDEQARRLLARAEAVIAKNPDMPATARVALQLAKVSFRASASDAQDLAEAEELLQELRRQGPSKDQVRLLRMLAAIYTSQGQYESARDALVEALRIAPGLPAEGASLLADIYTELSGAEDYLGRHDAAEAAQRKAVAISSAHGGESSLQAVNALIGLATHLGYGRRFADSLDALRQARERVQAWPESARRTALIADILTIEARVNSAYGHPEAALRILDRAQNLLAGPKASSGLWVRMQLIRARALTDVGDYAQAQAAIDGAQALVSSLGLDKSDLPAALNSGQIALGFAMEDAAAVRKAWKKSGAGGSPGNAHNTEFRRAAVESGLELLSGRPASAVTAARRGLDRLQLQVRGVSPRGASEAALLLALGRAQTAHGMAIEAMGTLRAALAICEQIYDPEFSPYTASVQVALGAAMLAAGDRSGAAKMLGLAKAIHSRHARLGKHLVLPLRELEVALLRP